MVRTAALILIILVLVIYAWRNWFIPVCVLVVMDAVMKHDDMPRSLFGIPGANPWNLILAVSAASWLVHRLNGQTREDAPPGMARVFVAFSLVIGVAFVRGLVDCQSIRVIEGSVGLNTYTGFMTDYLINPFKYMLAAFLLFEGATTRNNLLLGLGAIIAQAGLYALRVIHYVPPGVLLMSENPYRDRISRECGLHPNDMALVMVIGFWCVASCSVLWRHVRWWWRWAGVGGLLMTFVALGLTLSRGGFVGFFGAGLAFGVFRWRPLLFILPISLVLTAFLFPSVAARVGEGIGVKSIAGDTTYDADAISSGRLTDLWPPTVDKIVQSPLFGFGRMAILRTDLYEEMLAAGPVPQHPHNAYLEMLLDAGLIGLIASLALFIGFPAMALLRGTPAQPVLDAAVMTGVTAAAAMLLMAATGQTFFPREGVFTVLCAYALMLRAHLIRVKVDSLSECAPSAAATFAPRASTLKHPAATCTTGSVSGH